MKLFGLTLPFTKTEERAVPVTNDSAFTGSPFVYFGDTETVSPETALRFTAVFACIKVISETLASVPLNLYERKDEDTKVKADKHPLFKVLRTKPNNFKTSGVEFRQMLQSHVLLWGNGYAQIIRNGRGEVLQLIPLHPTAVKPKIDESLEVKYEVKVGPNKKVILPGDQVFHLRGYRDSGLEGLSPIEAARRAIQAGLSLESFGKNFFEGGAFPAGVLEFEGHELSDPARENLRKSWQELHGGANRGKKVAILEAGLKWKPMGIPQSDAQFLEQRRFQIEEIARIYRVPPHMLADLTRSTNNNIEQQSQEFVTYCMLPWFRMWEEAICRDFFDGDDRTFFAEFLLDGLLRGDTQARTAAYTAGINGGWLSKNDVRRKENMNPIGPEGDIYLSPMNMVPAGKEEEHQKDGNSGQEEAGVNDSSDTEENQRSNAHADEANAQKEKVAAAMRGAFKETWARIVRKEIKQVQAAARRKTSDEEFCSWVDEFAEEHRDFARDCLKDLYQGYAELVGKDSTNLDAMMRSYELEITSAAGDWVCKPSDGYRRSEGEIADYWTRRMLSYDPGEYETAA